MASPVNAKRLSGPNLPIDFGKPNGRDEWVDMEAEDAIQVGILQTITARLTCV